MNRSKCFSSNESTNEMMKSCSYPQHLSNFEVEEAVFTRSMAHKNAHVLEWSQKNISFVEFNLSNNNKKNI